MLDGQTHLVKQGWKGAGHPLKAGGRARPIVIAQKKTLGGIGKDRDESFAFWDHLYDVAAKSIKLKVSTDDSDAESDQNDSTPAPIFHRTRTGILSNRQPVALPTPSSSKSPSPPPPATSIISRAKQEAARRSLYSRFLRGPVITQNTLDSESRKTTTITETTIVSTSVVATLPTPFSSHTPTIIVDPTATPTPTNERELRKAGKAARRQAKTERREAKAARREAKVAKKARKAERAAKRAARLEKKAEKERKKEDAAQAEIVDIVGEANEPGTRVKKSRKTDGEGGEKKKRKRDRE